LVALRLPHILVREFNVCDNRNERFLKISVEMLGFGLGVLRAQMEGKNEVLEDMRI